MNCPFCGYNESKVVDSRPSDEGVTIRRRRECLSCGGRFTTFEILETTPLIVVKKDKSRQPFDCDKLLRSVMKACAKRPIPLEVLEKMVNEVEYYYRNSFTKEVTSTDLGELVMEKLRDIDQVAYVRFASVYRDFSDLQQFTDALKQLKKHK